MGFKTFGAETLLASDVNNYLMRQAVIRVADLTGLSAIVSPEEGMLAFVASEKLYYSLRSGVWKAVAGYTDWQPITLRAGFVGIPTPYARRNGPRVELMGGVTKTGSATGTAVEVWGDLPAGMAPPQLMMTAAAMSGSVPAGRLWASTDGSLTYQCSVSSGAVQLSAFSFPLN